MGRRLALGPVMAMTAAIMSAGGCAIAAGAISAEPTDETSAGASIWANAASAGPWAVGCSNLGHCAAIAGITTSPQADGPAYVRIDFPLAPTPASVAVVRESQDAMRLAPEAVPGLLAALRAQTADDLSIDLPGGATATIPRRGFAAVMVALDDWRTMPGLTAQDVVTPLPATVLELDRVPPFFEGHERLCPPGHIGSSLQAWRGGFGMMTLWRAGCGDEGLNPTSFWYLSGPQGDPPRPIHFEGANGPAAPHNSWFEADTGYLSMTHYFGGHLTLGPDDCGLYRVFAWGLEGIKLVEERSMPVCGTGADPRDWITIYRATVPGRPDTGP